MVIFAEIGVVQCVHQYWGFYERQRQTVLKSVFPVHFLAIDVTFAIFPPIAKPHSPRMSRGHVATAGAGPWGDCDVSALYLTPDDLKRSGFVSKDQRFRIQGLKKPQRVLKAMRSPEVNWGH